jgi:predicted aldo/keto reductase-like oxidoreductase
MSYVICSKCGYAIDATPVEIPDVAEIERLQARVQELEQDAGRYRWLREQGGWVTYANAERTDAAIDAAMKDGT